MPARVCQVLSRACGGLSAIAIALALCACSPSPRRPEVNEVVITKDGGILLNGKRVSCSQLEARYRASAHGQVRSPTSAVPPCNQLLLREMRAP
jgi:hypothetical protein